MKPPHCTILDPKPGIKGFISSCGHIAAVPFGNQWMIVYNGRQERLCRTEKTARDYIKKLQRVNVSNLQSSPITQTLNLMKKKLYRKSISKMTTTLFNRNKIADKMGDLATANAIYDEWVVDGQDPEDEGYSFLFLEDLTQV